MERRKRVSKALARQHRYAEDRLGLSRRQWPEWLMLLDLYQAGQQEMEVSFEALAATSGLSTATAFRRTIEMIEAGILERIPDPTDRRRSFVLLSSQTRSQMDQIMDRLKDILFP